MDFFQTRDHSLVYLQSRIPNSINKYFVLTLYFNSSNKISLLKILDWVGVLMFKSKNLGEFNSSPIIVPLTAIFLFYLHHYDGKFCVTYLDWTIFFIFVYDKSNTIFEAIFLEYFVLL